MKKKFTLAAAFALIAAIVGFVVRLRPDTFSPEHFDFIEYLVRLLALPFAFIAALLFLVFLVSSSKAGSESISMLASVPHCTAAELRSRMKTAGVLALILLVFATAFAGYGLLSYGRMLYVFARDRFLVQYQAEVDARLQLEENYRNWDLVKARLKSSPSGTVVRGNTGASATAVEALLEEKQRVLNDAVRLEKVIGTNARSLQLTALALSMHPWDLRLADRVRDMLRQDVPRLVTQAAAVRQKCNQAETISREEAGRALVTLGIHYDAELPRARNQEGLGEALCALIGDWSADRIKEAVHDIWTVSAIGNLVDRLEPERLSREKRTTWARWTSSRLRDQFESEGGFRGDWDAEEPKTWSERVFVPVLIRRDQN